MVKKKSHISVVINEKKNKNNLMCSKITFSDLKY